MGQKEKLFMRVPVVVCFLSEATSDDGHLQVQVIDVDSTQVHRKFYRWVGLGIHSRDPQVHSNLRSTPTTTTQDVASSTHLYQ